MAGGFSRRDLSGLASAPLIASVAGQAAAASAPPALTVWPLNTTESPIPPSDAAIRAATEAVRHAHHYPHADEDALIARIAAANGVGPDQVAITTGALEGLAMMSVEWTRGGQIAAPTLAYDTHINYLVRRGGAAQRVPMRPDLQIDLEAMVAAAPEAKLVYLVNPNNPTGLAADGAALRDACIRASAHAPVIVDEAFIDLLDDPASASVVDLVRAGHDVIVVGTFSKGYALAAFRIGYAIGPRERIAALKALVTTSHNGPGLAAALASYGDTAYLARQRRAVREGREVLTRILDAHGIPHLPSVASYVWADLGPDAAARLRRLSELGVPLRQFGTAYPTWARIAVREPEALSTFAASLPRALAG